MGTKDAETYDFSAIEYYLPLLGKKFPECYLVGGTALSLVYLQHRLSFDIDLFCPQNQWEKLVQDGIELRLRALEMAHSFSVSTDEIRRQDGDIIGRRFFLIKGNEEIKLDIIRENMELQRSLKKSKREQWGIDIADIEDLYRLKIQMAVEPEDYLFKQMTSGERLACRDIIDLYVLSEVEKPLSTFLLRMSRAVIHRDSLKMATRLENYIHQFDDRELFDEMEHTGFIHSRFTCKPDVLRGSLLEEARLLRKEVIQTFSEEKTEEE
jgi:predicted nucleotidyltransferase component of viral defense system